MTRRAKLAADIGGTFTDIVLEQGRFRHSLKILTTPEAPERAVLEGITAIFASSGLAAGDVSLFIHGTTLATNALIERKGAKTAFITTQGFRDILEQGYEKRFDHYDLMIDRPVPLVPRPLRFGLKERLASDGSVLIPLDEQAVPALAAALRAQGVEAVAIGLLHAYAHPRHEQRLRDMLAAELGPRVTICLSSEVAPEIREYERFSTTAANAYVRPLIAGYLTRLDQGLREMGIKAPLFLMMSGGGLTTVETARRFPIRLVESGPAGGAILAGQIARTAGFKDVLSFDMGGTTAKICLLKSGEPNRARRFEIARAYRNLKGSGLPVRIPVIEMVEIGAGGGSIARADSLGRIAVGPDSAGSEPGPVCYGRGGTRPTVTDANLLLGKIDPERFAAGRIRLDAEAAMAAMDRNIGRPLGLEAHWPAAGVAEIVEENMAAAARVHTVEQGRDATSCTMIAFGGSAPLHACQLARKLGIRRVMVPKGAGVGSAIGFLHAPVSFEITRSAVTQLQRFDATRVNALIRDMKEEALAAVLPALYDVIPRITITADCRYVGQGHEITIGVPDRSLRNTDGATLTRLFERHYETVYGLCIPGQTVEVITWSVTAAGPQGRPPKPRNVSSRKAPPPMAKRRLYDAVTGAMALTPVYWRRDLAPGTKFTGPALILEDETSTLVSRGFTARIDASGHIVMENRS